MIKFTYQEHRVYFGEANMLYTSTLLNDDMTNLSSLQRSIIMDFWDDFSIPEIFIKNTTIWNLLYNGDLIQRKLGYNLYKNTLLKNNGNINN